MSMCVNMVRAVGGSGEEKGVTESDAYALKGEGLFRNVALGSGFLWGGDHYVAFF